jgi:hypothetical protein
MRSTRKTYRRNCLGAAVVVLMILAADDPPKAYEVGEVTFQAPAAWKSVRPSSTMSQVQLVVEPVSGEEDKAVMTVSALRAGGGGVEANVKRWQSQFKDEDGNVAKVESKTVKGKNVDVTRVETAGHYYPPPFTRQPDKANYRLLGAIVQTAEAGYFFKMIGPDKDGQRRPAGIRPDDRLDQGRGEMIGRAAAPRPLSERLSPCLS